MAGVLQLDELEMFRECGRAAKRGQTSKADAELLAAMVRTVAEKVEPLLKRIPVTFRQYTEHDIGHSRNLIELMGRIVPKKTLKKLNTLELAMAMLAALLHDSGMYLEDTEKQSFLDSTEYQNYLLENAERVATAEQARKEGKTVRAALIEDALLAEFIRRRHAHRARGFIRKHFENDLVFRDADLCDMLADLCESHAWPVRASDAAQEGQCVSALPVDWRAGSVRVNVQYLACLLRLADVMDFDRSRTPVLVFQDTEFTEEKSWEEWNKHLQVSGWDVAEDRVRFQAECTRPAFYVAVHEFLDWVDAELRDCRYLLDEAPKTVAEHYVLHLPAVLDRRPVAMKDKRYVAGAFRFELDYERILKLLMDRSLYPDPSLFLRELLQNSLDACRLAEARAKAAGDTRYQPRIVVWDFSADPDKPRVVFQDNGVGMDQRTVEDYFMRVGLSYYRSRQFEAERAKLQQQGIDLEACSQFGIGILSCFLVADRFEVLTYRFGSKRLKITVEGPTKFFTIEKIEEPAHEQFQGPAKSDEEDGPLGGRPGTRTTVPIRPGVKVDVLGTLRNFAVNVDYDVRVHGQPEAAPTVIRAFDWEKRGLEVSAETLGVRDVVFERIAPVLAASRIPFEQWDFSKHVRGVAWFWLLRGADGAPCPERGYLSVEGSGLRIVGAPAVLEELVGFTAGREIRDSAQVEREYGDSLRFLSRSEREAVVAALIGRRASEKGLNWWPLVQGAVNQLCEGSVDVLGQDVLFVYPGDIMAANASLRKIALHGILIPGGIANWDPARSQAHGLALLTVPGVLRVDMRTVHAPVPAASRLFIQDDSHGSAATLVLSRAALRHALCLIGYNVRDTAWRNWLSWLLDSVLAKEDVALLEEKFPLAYLEGKERLFLRRAEIVNRFGPTVRLNWGTDPEALRDGLDLTELLTQKLSLYFHPFSGGTVNLESWKEPR